MDIIWITNFPLPVVQEALGLERNPKEGWLVQLSKAIGHNENINLVVLSPSNDIDKEDDRIIDGIRYITYPVSYIKKRIASFFQEVKKSITPDIIHIQGSENAYGAEWVNACGAEHVVVSIQGMPSVYERYFKAGISDSVWWRFTTLGDIIKFGNIISLHSNMVKRGLREKELISSVHHVIGRTDWDKAHCWAINPDAQYYLCNETLRKAFYEHKWEYSGCSPHTIFISQATLPLKGAHQVLKAMRFVKKIFPDVTLKIALCVNIDKSSFMNRLKRRNYGAYLNHLIHEYDLGKNVCVLGKLDEHEMLNAYLSSNVFVSPSSIENSPNSLGEAQILGMPTIASYVGGTDNIGDNGKATALYRYEEVEMLAYKLVQLFTEGPNYEQLSYARNLAIERHDLDSNVRKLLQIYESIAHC